jgi:murein endopeptidase
MNIRLARLLTVLLGFCAPLAQAGNGWSTVAYPLAGPPQVIGSYAAGCIAGAGGRMNCKIEMKEISIEADQVKRSTISDLRTAAQNE